MAERLSTAARLAALEKWRNWLMWVWSVATVVVVVAGAVFGVKLHDLWKVIENLRAEADRAESVVVEARKSAEEAQAEANRALIKAGDLSAAVEVSRKASSDAAAAARDVAAALRNVELAVEKAQSASGEAATSSRAALAGLSEAQALLVRIDSAVKNASESAKQAQATATVMESRIRELDKVIAGAKEDIAALAENARKEAQTPATPKANSPQTRVMKVIVRGMDCTITLRRGATSLQVVEIGGMGYTGTVYIPEGWMADVLNIGMGNTYKVSSDVKGCVTVSGPGMDARIVE